MKGLAADDVGYSGATAPEFHRLPPFLSFLRVNQRWPWRQRRLTTPRTPAAAAVESEAWT
jgi:hypothetical protein